MPTISIYYFTLNDFTFPLLFFGMSLALLQFSLDIESSQYLKVWWQTMLKKFVAELRILWLLLASIIALYIIFKLIMTAIGYIAIQIGRPYLFGQKVPEIDGWVGIGSVVVTAIILVYGIVKVMNLINRKRGKHNESKPSKSNGQSDHFDSVL